MTKDNPGADERRKRRKALRRAVLLTGSTSLGLAIAAVLKGATNDQG